MPNYIVKKGDCVSSISARFGLHPDTVWDHVNNKNLRDERGDGRVLRAGDKLFMPELRQRKESGATEERHRFVRKGVPEYIDLQILDENGEPRTNVPYQFEFDVETRRGYTNGEGGLREPLPPSVKSARLTIEGSDDVPETAYDLQIGDLDPPDDVRGIQLRLENIGLDPGEIDGKLGSRTREQIRILQARHGLEETGELDGPMIDALRSEHGS